MKFPQMLRRAAHSFALTLLIGSSPVIHAASRDEQDHACRSDALHFCSADVPDKAKITACMKQHYEQLSPQCKAMFDKPPQKGSHPPG